MANDKLDKKYKIFLNFMKKIQMKNNLKENKIKDSNKIKIMKIIRYHHISNILKKNFFNVMYLIQIIKCK